MTSGGDTGAPAAAGRSGGVGAAAGMGGVATLGVRDRSGAGRRRWVAPGVAAVLAVIGTALGWRGVDLPAQLYRVAQFQHHGLALWDSQWYGGHWTLDYSVIFPPIAAVIGVNVTVVASAGAAAWAFDRMVVAHFGAAAGHIGSLVFAVGTVVQMSIGQLPFLMGEALGLGACLLAARRRWFFAVALAIATSLASPLAGAFLALAGVAWLLTAWPRHRFGLVALLAGVAAPVAVVAVVFPGQGSFPFPFGDFAFEMLACVALWLLVPAQERVLRNAVRLYALATAVSFAMPTPVGGNVGRLGECLIVPIAACLLWPLRRWALAAVAIPMALWQWTPAWGSITNSNARDPSTHEAYYQPLLSFLDHNRTPTGRVEVVPTHYHWEAAYVAPTVALARGWERQLDTADNPLFYTRDALTAGTYDAWLLDNGVRFVAVPDSALDYAGTAEAELLDAGVPGLAEVWRGEHWRVFAVRGASGIVDGPARLVSLEGSRIVLEASAPGSVIVRVHDNAHWSVQTGVACLQPSVDTWLTLRVDGAGPVVLQLGLAPRAAISC